MSNRDKATDATVFQTDEDKKIKLGNGQGSLTQLSPTAILLFLYFCKHR